MIRTRVKMCGMTSVRDIELAVEAGADAVGIILAESPRRVDGTMLPRLHRAIPPMVEGVAVLVDPSDADAFAPRNLGLTLQFSGNESAKSCEWIARGRPYIKAFHVDESFPNDAAAGTDFANALWMFDTRVDGRYGGTGVAFAWDIVVPTASVRPIVMSGGLTPENVGACIRRVRPYAVDVRSGVETAGAKDFEKMCAFVRAVRTADLAVSESIVK
jgi:phosphoribosylanthranilate isomerase